MKPRASTVKVLAITNDKSIRKTDSISLTNPIFRLTGVNNAFEKRKAFRQYLMKKKLSKSFSTPQLKTSINLKKNAENPLFKRPKKTMNWDEFLKSNSKIGNKMVYSQPSAFLQEKISLVDKKIDKYSLNSEIINIHDSVFANSIKKLDKSANVECQVNEIYEFTLAKKEIYNEIKDEYNIKLEKLEILKRTLTELEEIVIETKDYENKLNSKRNELKKTRNDLWNESNYTDSLKFMASRTRDLVKLAGIPINTKNDELFRINIERRTESREIKHICSEAKQIEKKIKKIRKEMNSEALEKEQSLKYKLKIYEDQQRLKKCIAIEHKINQKNQKTKKNTKKLQEFEFKILELKQENLINKELIKLNRHLDDQERKFRAIQKATNSSSIEDVLPYYLYLKANQANLEKTLKESLALISNLSAEKKELLNEFNVLKYQDKENLQQNDMLTVEKTLKTKEEELKNYENYLERLETLILFAVNTLSRVSFQVSEDTTIEVTRNNIPLALGYICIKIEKIFNVIQNYQNVYYIESINTDIQYMSLPKFLKLLHSRAKIPET